MSGLPKLPERPKRKQGGSSKNVQPSAPSPLTPPSSSVDPRLLKIIEKKAQALSPAIGAVLKNPSLLHGAIAQDPTLQSMMTNNPTLASFLNPEKLQKMLEGLQDPTRILSQENIALEDLSKHRMNIMQLQNYATQLNSRDAALTPGSSASTSWNHAGDTRSAGMGSMSPADAMARMTSRMRQLQQWQQSGTTPSIKPQPSEWPLNPNEINEMDHGEHHGEHHASQSTPTSLHAPVQSAPFYGHDPNDKSTFSYSHSVKDVPLYSLPRQVQQEALASLPLSVAAAASAATTAASGSWQHQHGLPADANHANHHQRSFQIAAGNDGGLYGSQNNAGLMSNWGAQGQQPQARSYYEDVPPSNWRPEDDVEAADNFLGLYRRAWCSHADALFPPLWLGTSALLSLIPGLPLWGLVPILIVSFFYGMYVFAVCLAGIPGRKLPLSRALPSFIASIEVVYPVAYGILFIPQWHGTQSPLGLCLLMLLICLGPMHAIAAWSDPGVIRKSEPDSVKDLVSSNSEQKEEGEEGPGSQSLDPEQQSLLGLGPNGIQHQVVLGPNGCWTCGVDRPLRSKHCQVCNRCIRRFDHHCPAVGNCIGEGNQRVFLGYLIVMVSAQVCFIWAGLSLLIQLWTLEEEEEVPNKSTWEHCLSLLSYADQSHRGLLLLIFLQVPLTLASIFLATRGLVCAAANLTTTELIKRKVLPYLNHEVAGYCNRFDQGMLANLWQFWLHPAQDWWAEFEKGDKEMIFKGKTLRSSLSPGIFLRLMDALERQNAAARAGYENQQLHSALRHLGVDETSAAASISASEVAKRQHQVYAQD